MSAPRLACLAMLSCLCVLPAHAAPGDREEPIYLEADRVDIDDARGVSTYTGSVRITQGGMHLSGERVVVHSQNREPARYVTTGAPARFSQKPKTGEPEVVATARELEYQVKSEVLKLRGNAVIVQCADRFEGEELSYDAARSRVVAGGGQAGRIRMVIQPQRQGETRSCAGAPASAAAPAGSGP